jgi:NAD+ kinase
LLKACFCFGLNLPMPPLRTLAFVINAAKDGASEIARDLLAVCRSAGVETISTEVFPVPEGFLHDVSACCVIGGDGTMLGVASEAARRQVPLIGVNRGSLGFLTTFSGEEARQHFAELLSGNYRLAQRSLLECCVENHPPRLALNDVVVKDEGNSRLVRLEVFAGEEFVTEFVCDGLIFSTPTGSTAYNLSAGGPLVHPEASVIAMTPISPHTLSNRSIIFRPEVCLRVYNRTPNTRLQVAIDGQGSVAVCAEKPLEVRLSQTQLPLIQRSDYSHFAVLRTKLGWHGAVSGKNGEIRG